MNNKPGCYVLSGCFLIAGIFSAFGNYDYGLAAFLLGASGLFFLFSFVEGVG